MPLKRQAKATRAANWRRMAAWTSGGSWLLESKHDMISSGTDDGSSPAIRSEDPASRGGAPDSLSVSSLCGPVAGHFLSQITNPGSDSVAYLQCQTALVHE